MNFKNMHYQVVFKENDKFHILQDNIVSLEDAEFVLSDFLLAVEHLDMNIQEAKIYTIYY